MEVSHICQVPYWSLSIEQLTHIIFLTIYEVGDVTENWGRERDSITCPRSLWHTRLLGMCVNNVFVA